MIFDVCGSLSFISYGGICKFMKRRVFAWLLLAGFILLLLNLAIFKVYWEICLTVYIFIMLMYVFYGMAKKQ